jgi:AraC-like DNA-binding protein
MEAARAVFRRFAPSKAPRDCVEHFWMVKGPDHRTPRREILIPNGRPTLLLSLAEPGTRIDPLTNQRSENANVLVGVITRPVVVEQLGTGWYVGAQLTPYGLALLLSEERLVDGALPLPEWIGRRALAQLLAAVIEGVSADEPDTHAFDAFVSERIITPSQAALEALRSAIARIDASGGVLDVSRLAAELSLSYSTLYRHFRQYVGLGPKRFVDITRYYHFVGELLRRSDGTSTALLASLQGYADQAHAANTFKRFTGVTQGEFKRAHNGIAKLMHTP